MQNTQLETLILSYFRVASFRLSARHLFAMQKEVLRKEEKMNRLHAKSEKMVYKNENKKIKTPRGKMLCEKIKGRKDDRKNITF